MMGKLFLLVGCGGGGIVSESTEGTPKLGPRMSCTNEIINQICLNEQYRKKQSDNRRKGYFYIFYLPL